MTYEVLAASFGLDRDPRLARLGRLIGYLDIGGVSVADAAGFASVMAGARARHGEDDDALLKDMSTVLDCLYAAYPETEEALDEYSYFAQLGTFLVGVVGPSRDAPAYAAPRPPLRWMLRRSARPREQRQRLKMTLQ